MKTAHQMWTLGVALACGSFSACGWDGDFSGPTDTEMVVIDTSQEPDGGLEGRVCSPSGRSWVGGAVAQIRGTDRVTRTDELGRYRFEGLRPGSVELDITKGSFKTSVSAKVVPGRVTLVEPSCLGSDVSIAVVAGQYDNVESILADLGLTFDLIEPDDTTAWLRDPTSLPAYDMVFFNCGMRMDWRLHPEVTDNLRSYVLGGGAIYASDLAYLVVEEPFPEAIEFFGNDSSPAEVQRGLEGVYQAEIVDRNLQLLFAEPTATIELDLRNWAIATDERGGELLLRSTVEAVSTEDPLSTIKIRSVLATRIRLGKGTVVFTSFHNNRQTTGDMLRILEDVILSF